MSRVVRARQLHVYVSTNTPSKWKKPLVLLESLTDGFLRSVCNGGGHEDTTTCTACRSSCPPNQYIVGACPGASKSDTTYCIDCTIKRCMAGLYLQSWCDGTTRSDSSVCTNCSITRCPRGMYVDSACKGDGKSDSATCQVCQQRRCPSGFYLPECDGTETEQPSCLPCTVGSCQKVCDNQRNSIPPCPSGKAAHISNISPTSTLS
jgi:hypothetical protein